MKALNEAQEVQQRLSSKNQELQERILVMAEQITDLTTACSQLQVTSWGQPKLTLRQKSERDTYKHVNDEQYYSMENKLDRFHNAQMHC